MCQEGGTSTPRELGNEGERERDRERDSELQYRWGSLGAGGLVEGDRGVTGEAIPSVCVHRPVGNAFLHCLCSLMWFPQMHLDFIAVFTRPHLIRVNVCLHIFTF